MNELQKKWIAEGHEAVDKIKNALDVFYELKHQATGAKDYERAIEIKDMERELINKITALFEIRYKK